MSAGIDRQAGHRASAPGRNGPPPCHAAVRDAEAGAEGVVDHTLRADPLRVGQPRVTESSGGPSDNDGGGQILRMTARVGSDLKLLRGRRWQNRLRDGLQARL
jgi:hypothetical protein